MITLSTADNALKSFYLDAVTESLDFKANPFLSKIQRSSADVVGKDVKKLVKYGVSGGISAGTEAGALPKAGDSDSVVFTSSLKNLYGTIEISDKALRASANNEGAFVNILNDEMQSLIKNASYNFGRMLYGDGTGLLATITDYRNHEKSEFGFDTVTGLVEGMYVDVALPTGGHVPEAYGVKIVSIDRENKIVKLEGAKDWNNMVDNVGLYVQGSFGKELTGLKAIFENDNIYGVDRTDKSALKPYKKDAVGEIDENTIQTAMDKIEEISGKQVNFIVCSWGVRRALVNYFKKYNMMMPSMELEGGFKALSFNGIPVVADRFCPEGTMYLLNTDDFKIHQLCDWKWLEGEDGKILKQIPGKPVYTATLVKYAELMCEKPNGQGRLTGITEA